MDYGWVYKDPICKRVADEWLLGIDELITTFQVMDGNESDCVEVICYIQWLNPHLNNHTIENRLRSLKRRGRYITQEEGGE